MTTCATDANKFRIMAETLKFGYQGKAHPILCVKMLAKESSPPDIVFYMSGGSRDNHSFFSKTTSTNQNLLVHSWLSQRTEGCSQRVTYSCKMIIGQMMAGLPTKQAPELSFGWVCQPYQTRRKFNRNGRQVSWPVSKWC